MSKINSSPDFNDYSDVYIYIYICIAALPATAVARIASWSANSNPRSCTEDRWEGVYRWPTRHIYIYIHICIYVHLCIHVYAYMYIYTYIYRWTRNYALAIESASCPQGIILQN